MIQLLVTAAPVLLWLMTGFYTVFFLLLLKLFQKDTSHKIPLFMAAITFGLLYDAFVLALGTLLGGDSRLLKTLSYPRYILHGMLIPLMLSICVEALEANKKIVRAVGVLTAVLMIAGAVAGCKVSLKALDFAGVTRFITDEATPKWAGTLLNLLSIVPTLILIVCGIVLWKKKGKKELTLSGLLMFVFSAIAPATGAMEMNFLFSMFGEVGMVLYFWLFAKKEQIEE